MQGRCHAYRYGCKTDYNNEVIVLLIVAMIMI